MFREIEDKSLWAPSFLVQQVFATFVCPVAMLLLLPALFAFGWLGYLFVLGLPLFAGFKVERRRPWAVIAGKWVWILPAFLVAANVYDYASRESLRMALIYTFWPGDNSGEKGLGWLFFTIPGCTSAGYVLGLVCGARANRADVRDS